MTGAERVPPVPLGDADVGVSGSFAAKRISVNSAVCRSV